MWTIIKIDKRYFGLLKNELNQKLGLGVNFYNPKLCFEKYKNLRKYNFYNDNFSDIYIFWGIVWGFL